jgi:hypothetical protein
MHRCLLWPALSHAPKPSLFTHWASQRVGDTNGRQPWVTCRDTLCCRPSKLSLLRDDGSLNILRCISAFFRTHGHTGYQVRSFRLYQLKAADGLCSGQPVKIVLEGARPWPGLECANS